MLPPGSSRTQIASRARGRGRRDGGGPSTANAWAIEPACVAPSRRARGQSEDSQTRVPSTSRTDGRRVVSAHSSPHQFRVVAREILMCSFLAALSCRRFSGTRTGTRSRT